MSRSVILLDWGGIIKGKLVLKRTLRAWLNKHLIRRFAWVWTTNWISQHSRSRNRGGSLPAETLPGGAEGGGDGTKWKKDLDSTGRHHRAIGLWTRGILQEKGKWPWGQYRDHQSHHQKASAESHKGGIQAQQSHVAGTAAPEHLEGRVLSLRDLFSSLKI